MTIPGNWIGHPLNSVAVGAESSSSGSFTIDFEDVAIVSTDGMVQTVFNSNPNASLGSCVGNCAANAYGRVLTDPSTGNSLHYFITDHLGTSKLQLSAEGWPLWRGDFAPYGQEYSTGAISESFKFTGKERDTESGLDYFGARYYGSNMGRFMSPDWSAQAMPVPYADLNNPQSLNLYSYAGNNPIRCTDPDGHFWQELGNLLKYNHYVKTLVLRKRFRETQTKLVRTSLVIKT